ncbi:thiamine phosphate synthase [Streptococcus sp. CSL10205-OR2]|uniref:thiamine phosphate synthase n=1 Tax=Streptococcus sp. CSL10205-OR2 TaxID=2980558 RepID=UPI0021DB048B|nr:thiamine phosphate synthase [Streptococcus sp. CSL10205-OR2]MCU9533069.1 thiamine phosphate synthase [Streptococcus sp. CSL10205-OR2]
MKDNLKLYFVCGTADCPQNNLLSVVEEALKGGITLFQFREKGSNALIKEDKKKMAQQLQTLCHRYHVPFIIDDDIDLVEAIDADGLHIGQGDIAVKEARKRLPHKIIGLSVSTMAEYQQSAIELVDYIGVGPFQATQSKADAKPPIGNRTTKAIREINPDLPIVAIGGINQSVISSIIEAKADGVAIISAISKSPDVYQTTKRLRQTLDLALSN